MIGAEEMYAVAELLDSHYETAAEMLEKHGFDSLIVCMFATDLANTMVRDSGGILQIPEIAAAHGFVNGLVLGRLLGARAFETISEIRDLPEAS